MELGQPAIYGDVVRLKSLPGDRVLSRRVEGGIHKAVNGGVGIIILVEIFVPSHLKNAF